jgi:hypothetical protein
MLSTGVAGHVSIRPHHATSEALRPPFPHFDPFGTEFREPGRISHPSIFDFRLAIADFQLKGVRSPIQSAINNWQLAITKILLTFAAIPGDLAPVETSLFRR